MKCLQSVRYYLTRPNHTVLARLLPKDDTGNRHVVGKQLRHHAAGFRRHIGRAGGVPQGPPGQDLKSRTGHNSR